MAIQGTTSANGNNSLANEVAVYYERRFLERARAMLVHQEGGQLRALDGNAGKQVIFNRFSPLSLATTALTEGVNPTAVNLTDTQVTVTLAEYGNSVQVSRLLGTVDIDDRDKEKIDVVAQNMGMFIAHIKSFVNTLGTLKYKCIQQVYLCVILISWQPEASNQLQ